jgi:hypothetical protein
MQAGPMDQIGASFVNRDGPLALPFALLATFAPWRRPSIPAGRRSGARSAASGRIV